MADGRAKEHCRIGKSLFGRKAGWNQLCQDVAELFYPMRGDFTIELPLGDDFNLGNLESYPVFARETMGNAIAAMLRSKDWFEVQTDDEDLNKDTETAQFLEYGTERLRAITRNRLARFKPATNAADHDWVTFGQPVLSVEENRTREFLIFKNHHPRDCAWMLDEDGRHSRFHRKVKKTAQNIMAHPVWSKNAGTEIRNAAEKDPAKLFELEHVVVRMDEVYGDDRQQQKRLGGKPWLSVYIDVDNEDYLGEGGLPVFNYIAPAWRRVGNSPYGFSPLSINTLPDARMIQDMARVIIEQGEKAVDPPMFGSAEIFRDVVDFRAGGLTYVDLDTDQKLADVMEVVNTSQGIEVGLEMRKDVRELIAEGWLINRLFLPDGSNMREIEVEARIEEFRRTMMPFFTPIDDDYHQELLDVTWAMAVNGGFIRVDETPERLRNREIVYKFESPLNSAEGRKAIAQFTESLQIISTGAEVDETVLQIMDWQKATEDAVRGTGAPADWFHTEEERDEALASAEQAQAAEEAAAAAREGAGVVQDVAQAQIAATEAGLTQ